MTSLLGPGATAVGSTKTAQGYLPRDVLSSFEVGKVFKSESRVNGLDIDGSGQFAITSDTDGTIRLFDCVSGKKKKEILCQHWGASSVTFTHHSKAILEASARDCSVRYHSLHDNTYLATFRGHSKRVSSISMCRTNDSFISAALDGTIRIFDLRADHCMAKLKASSAECVPIVAHDFEGLIFAVGVDNDIKLYDMRQYGSGPFETFNKSLPQITTAPMSSASSSSSSSSSSSGSARSRAVARRGDDWTHLEFSPDGKCILVCTRSNLSFTVDSFEGAVLHTFTDYQNTHRTAIRGTFTPCGRYVTSGCETGDIHIWDAQSGKKVARWRGHPNPTRFVKWNPRFIMAVSCGKSTALWGHSTKKTEVHTTTKKSALRR